MELDKVKTKISVSNPTKIIFKLSNTPKLAAVIGWKIKIIRKIKEIAK